MSVDDDPKIADDRVLRIWQVIALIGDSLDRADSSEVSEFEYVFSQVEAMLLAIVLEMAQNVSKSTRQRRRRASFGKTAHVKNCWSGSHRSRLMLSYRTSGGASAVDAQKSISSRSVKCALAAASTLATTQFSSWSRFHATTMSVPRETSGIALSSRLASLDTVRPERSAIIDLNTGVSSSSEIRAGRAGARNLESLGDDRPSEFGGSDRLKAESSCRFITRCGVRIGLKGRLFLLIVAAVFPALAIQAWNEYDLRIERGTNVRQQVVRITNQLGGDIGELREGARQVLLAIAQLDNVRSHRPEACRALLSKIASRYPNYSLLGAADTDGRIYCASVPASYSSVADQPFFTRAMAQPGLAVGNYWDDPTSGQKMIHFAERFEDGDGHLAGVVFAGVDLAWLSGHLKERGLPPTTSILIADRDGNIIVRLPHPEAFIGRNMRKSHERIMDGDEAGWEEAVGVDGITRIFGYVPAALAPKDFFLSAGQSKASAFAAIHSATWHGAGLILGGLFAAISIAWAGLRNVIGRRGQQLFHAPINGAISDGVATCWLVHARRVSRRIEKRVEVVRQDTNSDWNSSEIVM